LSDHHVLILKAKTSVKKPKLSPVTRPLTNSAIFEYGRWLVTYNFPEVSLYGILVQRVRAFNEELYSMHLEIFATKAVTLSEYDKPWITPAIKAKFMNEVIFTHVVKQTKEQLYGTRIFGTAMPNGTAPSRN